MHIVVRILSLVVAMMAARLVRGVSMPEGIWPATLAGGFVFWLIVLPGLWWAKQIKKRRVSAGT